MLGRGEAHILVKTPIFVVEDEDGLGQKNRIEPERNVLLLEKARARPFQNTTELIGTEETTIQSMCSCRGLRCDLWHLFAKKRSTKTATLFFQYSAVQG